MKPWKRLPHDESYKVGWRHVMIKKFVMPDGQTQEYGINDKEGTLMAGIVALTKENKVVIARQFRPGPERIMDELPGGGVEHGEDPKVAALRELLEETGYKPERTEFLGIAHKEAYRNGVHHYFIGYGCVRVNDQSLDENEFVDVHEITIDQLLKNAQSGNMTDTAALFLAIEQLQSIQKK